VDSLKFSYIELQDYGKTKRILFKINDLLMDYNLVLEKKNNKWVIEEERKYVWHQMYKRENPELQTTKEKYCELCKKWSNHCSDFLNEMIDEIYEKIIKVPTVRIELLF
jgi:translation elongation factor EF-G